MKFKITAEAAVITVKMWLKLIVCWPPPPNATRKYLILQNVAWSVAVFVPVHLIPASIADAWKGPGDATSLTKNLTESLLAVSTIIKMSISKVYQSRLQAAVTDMEKFVKTSDPHERAIIDRYIAKCGNFYAFVEVLCIIACFGFVCGPLILPQTLPGHTEYPFEWRNSPKLVAFLYSIHVAMAIEMAAAVVIDIQVALLLWIAGIRFELLAECFRNACSPREFFDCIKKHQELIASVNDFFIAVRYFALNVVFGTGIINLCAGYQVVRHEPIEVGFQFSLLLCVTSLEVAMYAWPADNLMAVSESIAQAVYSSPWIGQSREVTTRIPILIMRSQKPMVITINGLLPALNLDFYGKVGWSFCSQIKDRHSADFNVLAANYFRISMVAITLIGGLIEILTPCQRNIKFVTTSFSYFTTLRAVIG